MSDKIVEKVSDDEYSTIPDAVDGAGGAVKPHRADKKNPQKDPAKKLDGEVENDNEKTARSSIFVKEIPLPEGADVHEEVVEVDEAVSALFEGEELSEDFKKKAALIFTAAINEQVETRLAERTAALETELAEAMDAAIADHTSKLNEALDTYLEMVSTQWAEDNRVALQQGVKVEMAESLIESLKDTFYAHNIVVDEKTADVVSELEEKYSNLRTETVGYINENLELKKAIQEMKAERVFAEVTEGLTVTQAERLRTLSEKLRIDDLDGYASDLETLKESFIQKKNGTAKVPVSVIAESETENEILTESTDKTAAKSIGAAYAESISKLGLARR